MVPLCTENWFRFSARLDVFGEDNLRSYTLGHLEGIADATEDLEEEEE
jgi:hypothetical protein